jgi:hypothetical protein
MVCVGARHIIALGFFSCFGRPERAEPRRRARFECGGRGHTACAAVGFLVLASSLSRPNAPHAIRFDSIGVPGLDLVGPSSSNSLDLLEERGALASNRRGERNRQKKLAPPQIVLHDWSPPLVSNP